MSNTISVNDIIHTHYAHTIKLIAEMGIKFIKNETKNNRLYSILTEAHRTIQIDFNNWYQVLMLAQDQYVIVSMTVLKKCVEFFIHEYTLYTVAVSLLRGSKERC
jgi:hypothetical protein